MKKIRILFVEDNEAFAGSIMRGLQRLGYEVSWVNTTADLDAQLAKGVWNVLLLDLYLGEESTIGRIAGIRAKYPGLKVIVASSEQQGEVIAECLRQGISEHIKIVSGGVDEITIANAPKSNLAQIFEGFFCSIVVSKVIVLNGISRKITGLQGVEKFLVFLFNLDGSVHIYALRFLYSRAAYERFSIPTL